MRNTLAPKNYLQVHFIMEYNMDSSGMLHQTKTKLKLKVATELEFGFGVSCNAEAEAEDQLF